MARLQGQADASPKGDLLRLSRTSVLAVVLAGGEGGRLDVLTEARAKPALPFAGVFRLVDFTLSNLCHSGIGDVFVLQQYEPGELTEHLANGRPWDLDRTHGGLRVLHPHQGRQESGWYEGNADALWRNVADIRRVDADVLLVLSADHVYTLDYGDVVTRHVEAEAGVTMVTTRVPREEAGRFGVVRAGADGRVEEYRYKPDEPESDLVATEVFAFDARSLVDTLEELAGADDEDGLADLGDELLPRFAREGRAVEHRLDGYWRDVGTVASYWEGHMELLGEDPPLDLDAPGWPILTRGFSRPPARMDGSAHLEAALVSPGGRVAGEVTRSVLGPGVVVEAGAAVRESVVLEDVVIRAGAVVERSIVDAASEVGRDARVGGDGEITLVGRNARIDTGGTVEAGARIAPRDLL